MCNEPNKFKNFVPKNPQKKMRIRNKNSEKNEKKSPKKAKSVKSSNSSTSQKKPQKTFEFKTPVVKSAA